MSAEYQQGVNLFSKALELALKLKIDELIVRALFMKSECLKSQGMYKQALAESLEAVSGKYPNADPRDMFNTYTNIISIGLGLPSSLQSIEKSLNNAVNYITTAGEGFWHAKIHLLKSNLYKNRGMYEPAIDELSRGWAIWKQAYPTYANDTYMKNFVKLFVKTNDTVTALKYFQKWETLDNEQPTRRIKRMLLKQIYFFRSIGKKKDALDTARIFNQNFTDIYDWPSIIEAYIYNGNLNLAVELLAKYALRYRSSESSYQIKFVFTLIGDYHFNCITDTLFNEHYDLKFCNEPDFSLSVKNEIDGKKVEKHFRNALSAYNSALNVAKEIDRKLECDVNQKEITKRLNFLGEINSKHLHISVG